MLKKKTPSSLIAGFDLDSTVIKAIKGVFALDEYDWRFCFKEEIILKKFKQLIKLG